MKLRIPLLALLTAALALAAAPAGTPLGAQANRFEVTCPAATCSGPLTGRVVLVLARAAEPEPRLAINMVGPPLFAIDVEQLAPGAVAAFPADALGYPANLDQLAPGEYWAQAVINVYTEARRSDGHTIWVALNDGRQEFFSNAGGNLYSEVRKVTAGDGSTVRLELTKRIPVAPPDKDTEWVKHVRIQSEKLTRFWGRPFYINATVLLPRGYADHPHVRYPVAFTFGHSVPFSFNPDSTRSRNIGQLNPVTGLETGYDFFKAWNADGFPRMIAVTFEQQTPYFADSYSMNSANNGPYGDAMVEEVIPSLEQQFRMIGKPYARLVEGASTGGWQTLALSLHYPDFFGGAWVLQPDPIDFTRYQLTDIYKDENAFTLQVNPSFAVERVFRRTVEGQPLWSTRQLSRFEAVLGSRRRGGYQLGAWEAVYGPTDADGYPKPLWAPLTGKMDRDVANYMREHGFDLRDYAARNWTTLGPKLAGKLHFFAGDMDDFYLNLAVYRMEEFLKQTTNPKSDATFTYGRPTKGHSWHAFPWAEMVRQMAAHVRQRAPAREKTESWNY